MDLESVIQTGPIDFTYNLILHHHLKSGFWISHWILNPESRRWTASKQVDFGLDLGARIWNSENSKIWSWAWL